MENFINRIQETSKEGLQKQLNKFPRRHNGEIFSGILWYLTKVPANDYVMKDISKEEYDTLQEYEPMMYRASYEVYRKRFLEEELRIKELNSKDHFNIGKICVDNDSLNENVKIIENKADFYGWDLSEFKFV